MLNDFSYDAVVNLFEPKAIAVIGASSRPEAVGYAILKNLIEGGYQGKIFPVNPKASSILNKKVFSSLQAITEKIDLAVLIVANTLTPGVLRECAQKKVGAAIIISAGFKEVGGQGIELENQIKKISQETKLPVLGPNCLGVIDADLGVRMNASFARTMPRAGNIAFISQSGALCTAILDYAKGKNIGFSKFVSLGNKAVLNELDMLSFLHHDPKTSVIAMYLEDLVDGRKFIELSREITGEGNFRKPILVIKSGRSAQGAKAASSHTGSLVGSDEVYDAIFAQAGVLRLDSVEEMFHVAVGFSQQKIPAGKKVAIITNAGGPGIMATDACIRYGLELAELSPATKEKLKVKLPPTANFSNPVDVIGDAQHDRYEWALEHVCKDPDVDAVMVILTPQAMTDIEEIANVIVHVAKCHSKTLFASFMGIVDVSGGIKILEANGIPHYTFPEDAARTLGHMVKYQDWLNRPRTKIKHFNVPKEQVQKQLAEFLEQGKSYLTIEDSMKVLEGYKFPVMPWAFCKSKEEAVDFAKKIKMPLAMKIVSAQIIHKFDVGGVRLNLNGPEEVGKAHDEMMAMVKKKAKEAQIDGVFLQGMSEKGREIILGMKRDPLFGPILMFGLGGVYVEALKDVTFRLAPIREHSAKKMIEEIRAFALLKGVRGEPPADLEALKENLLLLSQLAVEQPLIQEIDINPLSLKPVGQGAVVLDGRILIAQEPS